MDHHNAAINTVVARPVQCLFSVVAVAAVVHSLSYATGPVLQRCTLVCHRLQGRIRSYLGRRQQSQYRQLSCSPWGRRRVVGPSK